MHMSDMKSSSVLINVLCRVQPWTQRFALIEELYSSISLEKFLFPEEIMCTNYEYVYLKSLSYIYYMDNNVRKLSIIK